MNAHELALEMQAYMDEYKKKPKAEQLRIATDALVRSGLIDENGEFTDHYAYSREYYRNKGKKKK